MRDARTSRPPRRAEVPAPALERACCEDAGLNWAQFDPRGNCIHKKRKYQRSHVGMTSHQTGILPKHRTCKSQSDLLLNISEDYFPKHWNVSLAPSVWKCRDDVNLLWRCRRSFGKIPPDDCSGLPSCLVRVRRRRRKRREVGLIVGGGGRWQG